MCLLRIKTMMQQLKYFLYPTKVLAKHIDPNNHLNNVIYLQWMQEAAIEHVKANGVFEFTEAQALTWFAKKHSIEYFGEGFLADEIITITWVESITKISTLRRYIVYRKSDKKLLCKGETLWIMINLNKKRPVKIPLELIKIFDKYNDFQVGDITELMV